ncbi:MAG: hypothetical protein M3Y86_13165, partial [Verrucomicrobiota bacterium]|nr:hypothetical protein [Verrucomicrobiota bacterium]
GQIATTQFVLGGTSSLINQGTISADTANRSLIIGSVNTSFINQGTMKAINGGTLTFNNTFTQTAGSLEVTGSAIASNNALQIQGGLLTGYGDINAAISNNAMLRPALGTGGMNVTGNVSLLSSSQLVFQLGGLTQGSQYGFLNVHGNVSLGGNLLLSFVNGFQNSVTPNDTFTVLNSSSTLSGAFANVASGARLGTSGAEGSFVVTYGSGSVVLSNYAAGARPAEIANAGTTSRLPARTAAVDRDASAATGAARLGTSSIARVDVAAASADEKPAQTAAVAAPLAPTKGRQVAMEVENSSELLNLVATAEPTKEGKALVRLRSNPARNHGARVGGAGTIPSRAHELPQRIPPRPDHPATCPATIARP